MFGVCSVIRPIVCPVCQKKFQVDFIGRCVHCGVFLGMIKW